jgi:hypothetical protein
MYQLTQAIELGDNGGEFMLFADVNDDGRKEIIIRQSSEMYASEHNRGPKLKAITMDNALLFQLTCMTQEGEILWQHGRPWTGATPYQAHGGGPHMTKLHDWDNDGRAELYYLYRDRLHVLDPRDGSPIRELSLPTDALTILKFQNRGQSEQHLLLKAIAFSEWGYGNPLFAYDYDLNPVAGPIVVDGAGHDFILRDIDGDGRDEMFIGYSMLDADFNQIWAVDLEGEHLDSSYLEDIDLDGRDELIVNVDDGDFVILDESGTILRRRSDFPHPQSASIGRFVAGRTDKQVFLHNRATHGGACMMGADAETLWEFPCNGYSMPLYGRGPDNTDLILFWPNPGRLNWNPELEAGLVQRAKELGYRDLPITAGASTEPFVLNGSGEIVYRFPNIRELDLSPWGVSSRTDGRATPGFTVYQEDLNGDGALDLVFHDRRTMWVFS